MGSRSDASDGTTSSIHGKKRTHILVSNDSASLNIGRFQVKRDNFPGKVAHRLPIPYAYKSCGKAQSSVTHLDHHHHTISASNYHVNHAHQDVFILNLQALSLEIPTFECLTRQIRGLFFKSLSLKRHTHILLLNRETFPLPTKMAGFIARTAVRAAQRRQFSILNVMRKTARTFEPHPYQRMTVSETASPNYGKMVKDPPFPQDASISWPLAVCCFSRLHQFFLAGLWPPISSSATTFEQYFCLFDIMGAAADTLGIDDLGDGVEGNFRCDFFFYSAESKHIHLMAICRCLLGPMDTPERSALLVELVCWLNSPRVVSPYNLSLLYDIIDSECGRRVEPSRCPRCCLIYNISQVNRQCLPGTRVFLLQHYQPFNFKKSSKIRKCP
ncbi:hypothetical protein ACRALDRAFT_2046738 [Sodiomyces alcalophilus JCM 7366]|uniref:uncharacterized protein n=1 Tax=Sodiomyces alcalophilus JCM 7366 TaxID=591952 RepID=UPI0039B4D731